MMKTNFKLLLLMVNMTFVSLYCTAQEFQPGFKVGFSSSQISGDMSHTKDLTDRHAPYFGISLGKKLSSYFNIVTELNYSAQGDNRDGIQPADPLYFSSKDLHPSNNTSYYADFKKTIHLNYLELPILLQFYKDEEEKELERRLFFHIDIGPFIAYRIKSTIITSGTSQLYLDDEGRSPVIFQEGTASPYYSFDKKINLNGEIKRMNAGIIAAIGSGYKYDEHKFFVEARINKGLINIRMHSDAGNNKTSSFIFSAGYVYCFNYQRGPIVSTYVQ